MYYQYADKLKKKEEARLVRAWVGAMYLRNLPDALDLDVSAPSEILGVIGGRDPIAELSEKDLAISPPALTGRDCILLNGTFLGALTLRDIERLRGLGEFRDLVAARTKGDAVKLKKCVLQYLRAVGEEGPRISCPRTRTLEAHVRFKRMVAAAGGLLGIVISLAVPGLAQTGLLVSGLCYLLGKTSGSEKQLEGAKKEAVDDLMVKRTSLVDFCHGRLAVSRI